MVSWDEAVDRIKAGPPMELDLQRARLPRFSSIPIVILGAPGAGKTRLWSELTGHSDPRRMSIATDDGYLVTRNKLKAAMCTVPGQNSRPRWHALDELFGPDSTVSGVIFVASFGWDHIWPRSKNTVAGSLDDFSHESLRRWNRNVELENFRDTCSRIVRKYDESGPRRSPQWLLVLANKVDLYWDEVGAAADYYFRDSNSPFVQEAEALVKQLGIRGPSVHHLPVAIEADDYHYVSRRGALSQQSQLNAPAAEASLRCLIETMEELSHG